MKYFMFDVDGVLADFSEGLTTLAKEIDPKVHITRTVHQKASQFPDIPDKTWELTWQKISSSRTFWSSLPSIVSPDVWKQINKLNIDAGVYFVTARVGIDPLFDTKMWLEKFGIYRPNVLVTHRKADFCRAANITAALEDSLGTALDIERNSGRAETRSFLLKRSYNEYDTLILPSTIIAVDRVEEFLDFCFREIGGKK